MAAVSLLFFSLGAHTEESESKTPMGLVAWAAGILKDRYGESERGE
jgi:hypothetical protein